MLTLLELGRCQCRWPMTDEPPHYFCGETTDGRSYCPAHDNKAHAGHGKDWQALAGMIDATEQTVMRVAVREGGDPLALDDAVRDAEDYYDEPGGLMGRT